jgi:PHD/YefM family antitoxin component YafN of YafNO toxin-antitoxin module
MKTKNSKSDSSNTGYKGVCFRKKRGEFQAQVAISRGSRENQVIITLGTYKTLDEALRVREEYITNLF